MLHELTKQKGFLLAQIMEIAPHRAAEGVAGGGGVVVVVVVVAAVGLIVMMTCLAPLPLLLLFLLPCASFGADLIGRKNSVRTLQNCRCGFWIK